MDGLQKNRENYNCMKISACIFARFSQNKEIPPYRFIKRVIKTKPFIKFWDKKIFKKGTKIEG